MKNKELKELIDLLNEHELTELTYKNKDYELTLKKEVKLVQGSVASLAAEPSVEVIKSNNVIKTPIVGVFYDKPSPDAPVFKSVGDKVVKGDVICIIEAMKVMNEIKSDRDGIIERICVEDGQAVSFDDVLFELK